jgi:transposase
VYSNIKKEYDYSYLSSIYPDVPLSKDTITKLLNDIGRHRLQAFDYMRSFIARSNKYIIIDGTKIINDSTTNGSSKLNIDNTGGFSKQIKVLFSFDAESKMPVFFKDYRGNVLDKTAFLNYIKEAEFNDNSCLITDKGFNDLETINYLIENHIPYLIPLKRNKRGLKDGITNSLSTKYFYYEEDNCIVWYYKEQLEGVYRYYYKNSKISEREKTTLYKNMQFSNKSITLKASQTKLNRGGVIVFESNLDIEPSEIYKLYTSRWQIETFYKDLKSINNFGIINVHGDEALFGNLFISFISVYMLYTFINHIKNNTKYFGVKSIKNIISDLSHIQITKKKSGGYTHETLTKKDKQYFEDLGVVWCKV